MSKIAEKIKQLERIREKEKKVKRELLLEMMKYISPKHIEKFKKECGIKDEAG